MASAKFDYSQDFDCINFRNQPELYQIGRGEQGVLLVEPYKSEILSYWRFKDPEAARQSSTKIYQLFLDYLSQNDFVGADMARKFLQMGYTRSRRYANYKGGKKYASNPQREANPEAERKARQHILPRQHDPVKAESARIFKDVWKKAKQHPTYQKLKAEHIKKYTF
ncbi:MAG: DUF4385 domain-containing protein [Bacteroidota bacterium]